MFSEILRHLYGAYAALLYLVILSAHHSCSARKINSNDCAPSSCGNIHNISYPFRLITDPKSCGNQKYELACENNVRPTLYLNRVKYYVQAINYSDFSIRLVDAAVQKDDCFSVPHQFPRLEDYQPYEEYSSSLYSSLIFITCENQIPSPPDYILDTSFCRNDNSTAYNSSSSSSVSSPSSINKEDHSYVMVGGVFRDVPDICRINLWYLMPSSILPKNMTNMSYIDVHDSLVYGFELSCFEACCGTFKENRCNLDEAAMARYSYYDCGYSHPRFSDDPVGVATVFLFNLFTWTIGELTQAYISVEWLVNGNPYTGNMQLEIDFSTTNGNVVTWTISSNFLSHLVGLLITLLVNTGEVARSSLQQRTSL